MRLISVKLAGFKSFVDPTTVLLPSNIAMVVGPNGCGKSNIIDAVRWVVGESSAKNLRGESFTDVIFNGSETRQPTGMASVELLFDNADGRIGGEYANYAEILIRREVTREGSSTYYLNGSRCRRRDIQDLFLGTGFGYRGYAIIEQGFIGQIASARPDELRSHIEEAAGVSRYRERRREAENRIRSTTQNLDQLRSHNAELVRDIRRLKRQATQARRYKEFKQEERSVKASLLALRLTQLEEEAEQCRNRLNQLKVDEDRINNEYQVESAAIEKLEAKQLGAIHEIDKIQANFYEIKVQATSVERDLQECVERLGSEVETLETTDMRRIETAEQMKSYEVRIKALEQELAELMPKKTYCGELLQSTERNQTDLRRIREEWQQRWDGHTQASASAISERESRRIDMSRIQQLIEQFINRLDVLSDGREILPSRSDYKERSNELLTAAREEVQLYRSKMKSCGEMMEEARSQAKEMEVELAQKASELQSLRERRAKIRAIRDVATGRASTDDETEAWLRSKNLDGLVRLGEVLEVEQGWERAVESVLDANVKAIWVAELSSIKDTVKDQSHSALTFFENEKPQQNSRPWRALTQFVHTRGDVRIGSLLGGSYAIDSLEEGLILRSELDSGESFVTRDGTRIGRNWLRSTQASTLNKSLVESNREVLRLEGWLAEMERAYAKTDQALSELRRKDEECRQESEAISVRLRDVEQRISKYEEIQIVGEMIADQTKLLKSTEAEYARLSDQIQIFSREQRSLEKERQQNSGEESRIESLVAEQRQNFYNTAARIQSLENELPAVREARQRLGDTDQDLLHRRGQAADSIKTFQARQSDLSLLLQNRLKSVAKVENLLRTARGKSENIATAIHNHISRRGEIELARDGVREKISSAQLDLNTVMVNRVNVLDQLNATGVSEKIARSSITPTSSDKGLQEELKRLAHRISRLGEVNLAAGTDLEAKEEQKEYQDRQISDLEEALSTLSTAMSQIDTETRIRFKDALEKINTNLSTLFPNVFGGGRAELVLTENNLLEAGVEYMARPPGKRNTSITQLSGGEKALTAIALVFAIFQMNPSPVCLLDEVDAALDDANVARFADLIRVMSDEIQFLVISHNKTTIEVAGHLLGVTMHEAGVSHLVSVDVAEATALVTV